MSTEQDRYQIDAIYFLVLFCDSDLRVPIIRTLRYVGNHRRKDDTTALLFLDVDPQGSSDNIIFDESKAADVVLNAAELLGRLEQCFAGTLASTRPC
jgi:hypothetical protein